MDFSAEWETGTNLSAYGCIASGKFAIIVHGWNDSLLWLKSMVEKLLNYRGGCVIFVNYLAYVYNADYLKTLLNWQGVSTVITNKLRDMEREGVLPENIFIYGFSLGSRIAIDAAINFGKQKIGLIDGN